MRGTAPLLYSSVEPAECWISRCHAVHKQEYPAGFQDTRHFVHELSHVGKMVRSDAAGDTVESSGREWQLLGIGHLEHCISDALCQQVLACFLEHARREVGNGHLCYMWCHCQGGVPAPGSDIKRLKLWIPFPQFDESLQVIPCPVREAGDIALRRASKVILYVSLLLIASRLWCLGHMYSLLRAADGCCQDCHKR